MPGDSGRSWGHAVRRLTGFELVCLQDQTKHSREFWAEAGKPEAAYDSTLCKVKGCKDPAAFETTLLYVTGARGRVTDRRSNVCLRHCEAFVKKHNLAGVPDGNPPD